MTAPLNVWSFIYYLTEVEGLSWRQDDYVGKKIVDAVKGKPINGYFEIKVGGQKTTFNEGNIHQFLPNLFFTVAGQLKNLVGSPFDIVPIPNSGAVVGDDSDFKTLSHAREIAKFVGGGTQAVPALRWNQAKQRAHEGGSRDPEVHYENLSVVSKPTRPCVIYDDVITTGSQMIACSRRLAVIGCTPVLGIVVGRAVKIQNTPVFGWQTEPLEIDRKPLVWPVLG